jgi:putative ABC transport system permease protein
MFKSNLLTSFRHLLNNKGLSVINIFGLSVSIAICLLSYLFISYEYSHDDFHKKGDRIYQVINKLKFNDSPIYYNPLQKYELAENLKRDIPEIEHAAGFRYCGAWLEFGDKKFHENIAFTDSSFFDIFTYEFLIGSEKTALKNENDMYITQEFADKLISGNSISDYSNLIGQSVIFSDMKDRALTIAGILKNLPKNSSLTFDLVIPYKYSRYYSQSNNDFGNTSIYVCLDNAENKGKVEKIASNNIKKYYSKHYEKFTADGVMSDLSKDFTVELLNYKDKYLSDKITWSAYSEKGDKKRSSILAYISILVLFLACINYIMLSVGISMKRFKEIAVRKVFGSKRRAIILQFVTETSVTVFISIAIGLVISELCLPFFNNLTGYSLDFKIYTDFYAYSFLIILFAIIVCIISIPAVYISKQNPVSIFRHNTKMGSRLGMAKSFIVIQFTLSLILIIASVFIVKQIDYMKSRDVGFNTNNLISVGIPSDFKLSKAESLQNRFRSLNGVLNVGGSDRNFVMGSSSSTAFVDTTKIQSRLLRIDTSYLNSLGITLLKGRNLRETDNRDSITAMIVNETFARNAGLDNPVGHLVKFWSSNVKIVGLVKDFNFDSMHRSIEPLICFNGNTMNSINHLFVKIKEGKTSATIEEMKNIWREFEGERELEYSFLGDNLRKQYKNEERISKMVTTISILALMISVFGLIGLTMLLLMQKIKEIGIRKINGASTWQILYIINKEFSLYLLIASVIAIPTVYYGVSKWLEEFAYKTPMHWWIFLLCLLALGSIVIITISYKSVRAAMSNPVIAIKYE